MENPDADSEVIAFAEAKGIALPSPTTGSAEASEGQSIFKEHQTFDSVAASPSEDRGEELENKIATDFYIEFQTVCQRENDDTLPTDVAKWVMKWL